MKDLVEKIRLLEDKLIVMDDTLNIQDDVELFISEQNCSDLNKTDPEEEPIEYHLIACSKCTFKTICNTELKIHKVRKHTFFKTLEYSMNCQLCEKTCYTDIKEQTFLTSLLKFYIELTISSIIQMPITNLMKSSPEIL